MAATKRSNNLLILIGVVFLVVGAGLVIVLLRSNDDGSGSGTGSIQGNQTVAVVVSKRAISRGTPGTNVGEAVEVRQVAAVQRPSDALTSLSELADRTAIVDIGADQILRAAFFRQRTAKGGAIVVPEGKQAVAVTVPFTPAGAGYVGQGDMVNVYALVTQKGDAVLPACNGLCDNPAGNTPQSAARLILTNVPVLDVSQEIAPSAVQSTTATSTAASRDAGAAPSITYLLAVDASQAEKVIFFTSYAELYLSLVPKDQQPASAPGHDQLNALKT